MNILDNESLYEISGGAISRGVALALGALGIFIVGVIDGFIRPLKCNR